MAFRFTARRHMRLAITLVMLSCVAGVHAQDASPTAAQQQPAATHIAATDELTREDDARTKRREQRVDVFPSRNTAEQHDLCVGR